MPDEISAQILSQTSQSINKLFELSTRIDERVRHIQAKQEEAEVKLERLGDHTNSLLQRLIVVEQKNGLAAKVYAEEVQKQVDALERRVIDLEHATRKSERNWSHVFDFVFKLMWAVFAAYLLYVLKLQAPVAP
jgi:polyhydroxyalkanoate synthesis regulator phasin